MRHSESPVKRNRIYSRKGPQIPKITAGHEHWWRSQSGYINGRVWIDGRWLHYKQHRWVMELHLGRKIGKDEDVHHLNGVRDDNRIENLEVISKREHGRISSLHGLETGANRRGSNSPQAKLTESIVAEILGLKVGGASNASLAKRFGVSSTTIKDIVFRRRWKHVRLGAA